MKPWLPQRPHVRNGLELKPKQREIALKHFTDRHTGQHVPEWIRDKWSRKAYPLPAFHTDYTWLRRSWFYCKKDGTLDLRFKRWLNFKP